MTRVAVVGAFGRLGSVASQAIDEAEGLELVARVGSGDQLDVVVEAAADVALELTTAATVGSTSRWLLAHDVHTVVGASGLADDDLSALRGLTGSAHCLVVPNFAIGAVLAMQLAARVAAHLPDVEITELHHDRKADAPSGTAVRTARMIAEARAHRPGVPGPDGHPARGALVDGIPVHSVRLPGLVASQEVTFGGAGQTLTIRHDSLDRTSFVPGILLAVRGVADLPGLHVGLEHLL